MAENGASPADAQAAAVNAGTHEPAVDEFGNRYLARKHGPRIVVTFAGPGLADLTISHEGGVTDGQAFAAAFLMDNWAREIRTAILQSQAMRQLVPVRGGLPDLGGRRPHG